MNCPGVPEYPKLAAGVRVERGPEGPVLVDDRLGQARLSLGPDAAVFVERVLSRLDGSTSFEQLLAELGAEYERDSVASALDQLAERSLLVEGRFPTAPVHGLRAYRALRAAEPVWQRAILADPTYAPGLAGSGRLSPEDWRSWYRGWWAENLHFAASAAKKFALTAAGSEQYGGYLGQFFREEYDHVLIFRHAARALGIDADAVMRAPPLPEMAALSSFILTGCRRDPLYLGWVADQVERAARSYMLSPDGSSQAMRKVLEDRFGDNPEFLHAVFHHADLEDGAEHSSYGLEMFEATPAVTPERLAVLLDLGEVTEHLFARKENAVFAAFSPPATPLPRPATNDLARLGPSDDAVPLARQVARAAEGIVAGLVARPSWGALARPEVASAFAASWAHVTEQWAHGALETPARTSTFDARFAATSLAVDLGSRAGRFPDRAGARAPLAARGLGAVLREAAETDTELAFAQAALLERFLVTIGGRLGAAMPEDVCGALRADGPNGAASVDQALEALGPVGPLRAGAAGVHLQVTGELVASLLDSLV